MDNGIIKDLERVISKENLLLDEIMSRHTTFRTGGPASLFLRPENKTELFSVLDILKKSGEPFFILGKGSNLLVSDKGYDGAVISLDHFDELRITDEGNVYAGAGVQNSAIAAFARERSLTGFEFAAGIPGSIGGAMIMNAGAYGGEMKNITKELTAIDPNGTEVTIPCKECCFGYRTSMMKERGYIVLSALLTLAEGDSSVISERMTELALKRKEKQPLEYPSAGSTFKRPEGNFAGKLIEEAGLRGFSVGDAQVSEKHCGFVINKRDATSSQIYELICIVRERVRENSGITLEPEVIMIGEF
ncbi:MAG: UDP-N-acetylmuramate dehydrogenase [Butyrivibrio sp.]|nr:UDP-N-acetylmuramate dehydrogenase [Butyrivibrio sp.]